MPFPVWILELNHIHNQVRLIESHPEPSRSVSTRVFHLVHNNPLIHFTTTQALPASHLPYEVINDFFSPADLAYELQCKLTAGLLLDLDYRYTNPDTWYYQGDDSPCKNNT